MTVTPLSARARRLAAVLEPLRPEGRPLFAGLRSLVPPDDPVGRAWLLADALREHRGTRTSLRGRRPASTPPRSRPSGAYNQMSMRSNARSRAWADAHLDEALDRLRSRGLVTGDEMTDAGWELREAIEVSTDDQVRPALGSLGDDVEQLIARLEPWARTTREGGGYPWFVVHEVAVRRGV
jgi:hypothetical protein